MVRKKELFGFDRKLFGQCAVLFIGILGSLLISNYLLLFVAGFTLLTAMLGRVESVYYQLLFTIPFMVIYKMTPTSSSLFAYVMMAVALLLLIHLRRIHPAVLAAIVAFTVYAALGAGENITSFVKMVMAMLLLYFFVTEIKPSDFKNQILAFSLGTLGASIIGLFKKEWPYLGSFFENSDVIFVSGELKDRFTGLNYDPNYYSVGVLCAIVLCVMLVLRKEANRSLLIALIVALALFGFSSYSKMYLVAVAIMVFMLFLGYAKTPKRVLIAIVIAGLVLGGFFLWADSSHYADIMFDRFSGGDISTGRFDIWEDCMEYIFSSPQTFLFGDGLGALHSSNKFEPHNAYIELLYLMGVLGGIVTVGALVCILRHKKHVQSRTLFNYLPLIIFGFALMMLGFLTTNELMFYFMLVWVGLNMNFSKTPQNEKN